MIKSLSPCTDELIVDATLGGGGYAEAILERGSRLIGIDRDPGAVLRSAERLARFGSRARLRHGRFSEIKGVVREEIDGLNGGGKDARIDGLVADLGFSSFQIDDHSRGFSFRSDAVPDMRMDPGEGRSAWDLITGLDERELSSTIRRYGEEPRAGSIAKAIRRAAESAAEPLTSAELAGVIADAAGGGRRSRSGRKDGRRGGGRSGERAGGRRIHPATRTFQALRIAVNDEVGELESLLDEVPRIMAPGGRVVFVSFHSIEDRIVKERFASWSRRCSCPPELPVCVCGGRPRARLLVKGAVRPGEEEKRGNPRAASARMRAILWLGSALEPEVRNR